MSSPIVVASLMAGLVLWGSPAAADMGEPPFNHFVQFEELEYGFNNENNPLNWDNTSWFGGDWNRIWFKTEGEMSTVDPDLEGEAQLLYSRLIAPFWEFQIGLRGDLVTGDGPSTEGRGHLVVGLEGLAPLWFEVEPAIFVSHRGDVSARLRTTYDLFITQRLIVHPSFEMNVAIQSAQEFGVGSGFNDIELGLRLGYQIAREFAPYLGISWNRAFAETVRLRQAAGRPESDLQGVAGLRFWF
ncbi:MAG: copper resistance protein B [Deltaproteobacteria bacterium]|nr:copper resistance protein B [Deltaproteobacteria bacterium]